MSESTKWTYKWQITDPSMLKQMKNAQNKKDWVSSVFSACGFRWTLRVYPNGNTTNNEGYVHFFLTLAFVPPKIKSVVVAFKYGLIEIDQISDSTSTYSKQNLSYGWGRDQLKTVKIKNLNTLTFAVK
eukprot:57887_1